MYDTDHNIRFITKKRRPGDVIVVASKLRYRQVHEHRVLTNHASANHSFPDQLPVSNNYALVTITILTIVVYIL